MTKTKLTEISGDIDTFFKTASKSVILERIELAQREQPIAFAEFWEKTKDGVEGFKPFTVALIAWDESRKFHLNKDNGKELETLREAIVILERNLEEAEGKASDAEANLDDAERRATRAEDEASTLQDEVRSLERQLEDLGSNIR